MSNRVTFPCLNTIVSDTVEVDSAPSQAADGFVLNGISYSLRRALASGLNDAQYERVRGILIQNVTSGRALRVMAHYLASPPATCDSELTLDCSKDLHTACTPTSWEKYQQRVIHAFQSENARYDALHEGNMDAWQILAYQLAQAAQRMLLHSGACSQYARDQADELSQQACEQIYAALYPWDIPFDLWCRTVVRNIFLQRCTRSHDLMDREIFAGDAMDFEDVQACPSTTGSAAYNNYTEAASYQGCMDANELIGAIKQMQSQQRRAVIMYTYYEELSDKEIAKAIGKSCSAVQTLRHRALRQLRALLA